MTVTGRVSNGVVVLPPDVQLADGTEVALTPLISAQDAEDYTSELLRLSKLTKDLPADLAKNHDHYLHGLPKK